MRENIAPQKRDAVFGDFGNFLRYLRSVDAGERKKTFLKLSELNDPRLIPSCTELLRSKDPIYRFVACELLGNMKDYESLSRLTTCLRDEDKNVRVSACNALSKIGDLRSITPLLERLKDRDLATRKAAYKALDKLGDGNLARAIMDDRIEELVHIAENGDPRAMEPLLSFLIKKPNGIGRYIKKSLLRLFDKYEPELDRMLCMGHFTRFKVYTKRNVKVGIMKCMPMFGCRVCRRIISAMTGVRVVIAVMDNKMKSHAIYHEGVLEVNYLAHRKLFDFDKVVIRRIKNKEFKSFVKRVVKNPERLLTKKTTEICCELHKSSGLDHGNAEVCKYMFKNVKESEPFE